MALKEIIDKTIKNKINRHVEKHEFEIIYETVDEAVYRSEKIIDQNLHKLFKEFFVKIFINLFPILVGLIAYILDPNDITKRILISGYIISIIIGTYEFIKFCIKTWYFFKPVIGRIKFVIKAVGFNLSQIKSTIKHYLQYRFIVNELYNEIKAQSKQKINEELNENKLYQFGKELGYEYQYIDKDAQGIADHIVYETEALDMIWEEIIRYIKYSLLTKWLFTSIIITSYIIIFRLFILPIIILSI